MAIWDFSREDTWRAMEQRAADDAAQAVNDYWPYRGEASPKMPQNLDKWARWLTLEFMNHTLGLPLWALQNAEASNGTYLTVRNAYYITCYRHLKLHVWHRIDQSGTLPRRTAPPHDQQQQEGA